MHPTGYGPAVQHNFRRTQLLSSREDNISSLDAAVQHNFRRTQLLPSGDENISSLGATVQHSDVNRKPKIWYAKKIPIPNWYLVFLFQTPWYFLGILLLF